MSDADGGTDDVVGSDLELAELVESSGMQNAIAVGGPLVLLAWPLTWSIGWFRRQLARRR